MRRAPVILALVVAGTVAVTLSILPLSDSGPSDPAGALDCYRAETCDRVHLNTTLGDCAEWFPPGPGTPNCTRTATGTDRIALITDPANHVPGPVTGLPVQERVLVDGLPYGWDLEFTPGGTPLVTLAGRSQLAVLDRNFTVQDRVQAAPADGSMVLGLAVDPAFDNTRYAYIYYIHAFTGDPALPASRNRLRLSRFRLVDGALRNETVLLDDIPGGRYHFGGRVEIGPDGRLHVTAGDAGSGETAQDPSTLPGSILRIARDGTVPPGNPSDSPVLSHGHRNPQGLAWSPDGTLYATEHGAWRYDEINRIEPGRNYGWPAWACRDRWTNASAGNTPPVWCTDGWTLAPSGATFVDDPGHPWHGSMFVAGLRGKHLRRFTFDGEPTSEIFHIRRSRSPAAGRRLRDVEYRDGALYVLTDSRSGAEGSGIIRLRPG